MPQEVQLLFTMAIAGVMIMTLVYLSLTIPAKLILGLRLSWASVIASLCMCWSSKIFVIAPILLVLPQESFENRWITGLFMMIMLFVYVGFLYLFQPDSLHQLTVKNLKNAALLKNSYLMDHHKKEWIVATKNKDTKRIAQLDIEIAKIQDERREIKRSFSKLNWLRAFFKRKEVIKTEAK